jgi:hypothetical protein
MSRATDSDLAAAIDRVIRCLSNRQPDVVRTVDHRLKLCENRVLTLFFSPLSPHLWWGFGL